MYLYSTQVIKFIKSVTGAKEVFPFDHNLRFADHGGGKGSSALEGSAQKVQRPIGKVHTDYTIHSAPRRLLDLIRPPTSNDTWSKYLQGRWITTDMGYEMNPRFRGLFFRIH